ncbi:MAG: hypothetical protein WBB07_04690 [Mycobacterium sp.]
MHVAARSYLATGIALVGAGAIAISPLSPVSSQLPDITVPAISSVPVALSSLTNPIELWVQVLTGAVDNAGTLGQDWLSDPAPLLRQFITNQIGYLETLSTAGGDVVTGLVNYLTPSNPYGLVAGLQNAFGELAAGDIAQGVSTLLTALITAPIVGAIGIPLLGSGLLEIPVTIAQNVTDAITAALSFNTALPLLLGTLGPVLGPLNSLGTTGQEIYDSLAAGDIISALTAVVNIPAVLTGAALNGFTGVDGTFFPGLLSYDAAGFAGGLVQSMLLTIPRALAAAIGASPPAGRTAGDEVSALTTDPAATVTLDIAAAKMVAVSDSAADSAPEAAAGPATDSSADSAPEAAAPEPAGAAPIAPVTDDQTPAVDEATDETSEEAATDDAETEATPRDEESDTPSRGNAGNAGSGSNDSGSSSSDNGSSDNSGSSNSGGKKERASKSSSKSAGKDAA